MATPEAGVPNAGAVKTGLVNVLFVNVSVPARVASVPVAAGRVMVVVPAIAGETRVAVPEVEPLNIVPVKVGLAVVATLCPMDTVLLAIETPVPPIIGACFPLKVVQSVLLKYPLAAEVASGIENPPVELLYTKGLVALRPPKPIPPKPDKV